MKYHGKVVGVAGGTGSAFAVIPAQNATGNWIKVVQRLPVRIALDPAELARHPLRVGLSMNADIDTAEEGLSAAAVVKRRSRLQRQRPRRPRVTGAGNTRAQAAPWPPPMPATTPPPLRGTALVLAGFLLAIGNFMVVLDMTIANVSVPQHRRRPGRLAQPGHLGHHLLLGGRGDHRAPDRLAGAALRGGEGVRRRHARLRPVLGPLRPGAVAGLPGGRSG